METTKLTYITESIRGIQRQENEIRVTRGFRVRAYNLETVDQIADDDTEYERDYDFSEVEGALEDTFVPNKKFAVQSQIPNIYSDMIEEYADLMDFEKHNIVKIDTEDTIGESGNIATDVAITVEGWNEYNTERKMLTNYYRVEIMD